MRRYLEMVAAVLVSLAVVIAGPASVAHAANGGYLMDGEASGVLVQVGTVFTADNLRLGVPTTGDVNTTTSKTVSRCLSTVGLVTVQAACVHVAANETTGVLSGAATMALARIAVAGLPVIQARAISSTATETCAGAVGSSTIGYLKIGNTVVVGRSLHPAPNTTITVGALTVILNDQGGFGHPGSANFDITAVDILVPIGDVFVEVSLATTGLVFTDLTGNCVT
jgi:hypothetical protein